MKGISFLIVFLTTFFFFSCERMTRVPQESLQRVLIEQENQFITRGTSIKITADVKGVSRDLIQLKWSIEGETLFTGPVFEYTAAEGGRYLCTVSAEFGGIVKYDQIVINVRDARWQKGAAPTPPGAGESEGKRGFSDFWNPNLEGLIGQELLVALRSRVLEGKRTLSYSECINAVLYTDESSLDSSMITLFHTGWNYPKLNRGEEADQWMIDWAYRPPAEESDWQESISPDLHLLFPGDVSVLKAHRGLTPDRGGIEYHDESRFNHTGIFPTGNRKSEDTWEPRDAIKGDTARILFYHELLWGGGDNRELLLEWHLNDPVDGRERRRNERVFEVQGNRNPFVDRPELVALLWETEDT